MIKLLLIFSITVFGMKVYGQDTLQTACDCNAAQILVIEDLIQLLQSAKDQGLSNEEKQAFVKELQLLKSAKRDLNEKCRELYASKTEVCSNDEKLKEVNDDYQLLVRILETERNGGRE